ncbi:MAG: membrane protein insertase YidC [Kiritimatiellia bacterium]
MNKTDRVVVGLLVAALIAWSFMGRQLVPEPEIVPDPDVAPVVIPERPLDPAVIARDVTPAVVTPEDVDEWEELPEPVLVTLSNAVFEVAFTSHGGAIASIALFEYAAGVDRRDEPVVLDFAGMPALRYGGLPGFARTPLFRMEPSEDGSGIVMTSETEVLRLVRHISLTDGYEIAVRDVLSNLGDAAVVLEGQTLHPGPMELQEAGPGMRGMSYLGVDFLPVDGGRVVHTGRSIRGYFGVRGGCGSPDLRHVPLVATERFEDPVVWAAVKNKFFVQIVEPDSGVAALVIEAERGGGDAFVVSSVGAVLALPVRELAAGEEIETSIQYYAGPKKYTLLRQTGNQRADVMEFGRFFKWICQILLPLLNGIEHVIPGGYGVAVILLTIIVKLLFWPVTHKGTESMKRMQALQPELKKLREKYKSDPKKMQEKQMLLYREHKVNPLAGCIPMVIQIPVFIGLFTVLRSAVELRFARFLWIADLSEPEGLLAGVLPFPAGGLNILPLLMTATMVLQQRLTPSAGDPQQQKMMAFMPIMMLFIFYNMPSGLVLYWSVSQGLSIVQLYLQRQRDAAKVAA